MAGKERAERQLPPTPLVERVAYVSRISLAVLALNYFSSARPHNNPVSPTLENAGHSRTLDKPSSYEDFVSKVLHALTQPAEAAPLTARTIPKKGDIIFLAKGIEIREGPGKKFKFTVTVPVDNWAVKVIGDKVVCADDWIWIDISRKDAGDPSGGTGWAALFTPCIEPPTPTPPTPSPQPSPSPTETPTKPEPTPAGTLHDAKPEKGKLYYLKKDTQIREGPGFRFKFTVAAPEDNWAVMAQNVSNSPQCADDWEWWDTSRFLAGDPSGGTGWVAIRRCEIATPIPTPTVNPVTPTAEPLPIATPTIQRTPAPQATPRPNPTPKPAEPLPFRPTTETPKKPDTGTQTIGALPKPGAKVDLSKGTEIRSGPGFHFGRTIPMKYGGVVPHDNWTALVLSDNPVCSGGWWWINVDRGAIVGGGNGTGWAAYSRCEIAIINLPLQQPKTGEPSAPNSGLTRGGVIEQKWLTASFLGSLTEAERIAAPSPFGTTGRVANFQGGFIHTSSHGTYETHGDIAQAYLRERGSGGWLGFPISDEYIDPNTSHARSDFEGGYITWRSYDTSSFSGGYTPFDYKGCPNRDCGGVSVPFPFDVIHSTLEFLTGVEGDLEKLTDDQANLMQRGIAGGSLVLNFLPGGITIKSVKEAKSVLVPAERLAIAASKELSAAQRSLIDVLSRLRYEKAVEKLGKLAEEYWAVSEELGEHILRHGDEFWSGISKEELTGIALEIIENPTSIRKSYTRAGGWIREGFCDAGNTIFVAINSARKINTIFKPNIRIYGDCLGYLNQL